MHGVTDTPQLFVEPPPPNSIACYRIGRKAGLIFMASGAALSALFFSAPVSIPFLVGGAGMGISVLLIRPSKVLHAAHVNSISILAYAILTLAVAGCIVGGAPTLASTAGITS
jgi:hypothetical protein